MYYPQQSPSIQHKLSHDQNPWTRAAPGYAMYNGTMHPQPFAHAPMHHHQNSINHYSSPPTHPPQISPATMSGQVMSQHWQQQLLKYEVRNKLACWIIFVSLSEAFARCHVHPDPRITVQEQMPWLRGHIRNPLFLLPTPMLSNHLLLSRLALKIQARLRTIPQLLLRP